MWTVVKAQGTRYGLYEFSPLQLLRLRVAVFTDSLDGGQSGATSYFVATSIQPGSSMTGHLCDPDVSSS